MSSDDIAACILALTPADFHKSMPARNSVWSGCIQDVYRPAVDGEEIYIKFQVWPEGKLYVVSFKRKNENTSDY